MPQEAVGLTPCRAPGIHTGALLCTASLPGNTVAIVSGPTMDRGSNYYCYSSLTSSSSIWSRFGAMPAEPPRWWKCASQDSQTFLCRTLAKVPRRRVDPTQPTWPEQRSINQAQNDASLYYQWSLTIRNETPIFNIGSASYPSFYSFL